jgi:RNA polymerase sigma factor for flagellar operon FliA
MSISLPEYQEMLQDSRGCQLIYYEDFAGNDDNSILDHHCQDDKSNPLELLLDENFRNTLIKSIESLPEREKAVMGMHYEQELNLREIGEVLGVSESRVCQLHSQAIARLRSKVKSR